MTADLQDGGPEPVKSYPCLKKANLNNIFGKLSQLISVSKVQFLSILTLISLGLLDL